MLILTLLILACIAWLIWEWKSAALAPRRRSDRPKPVHGTHAAASPLPTAAALGVDADAAVRFHA